MSLRSVTVESGLLERVLAPYFPHCRYVRAADASFPSTTGTGTPVALLRAGLSIPSSCYIDDTGHFNSVEFNICYNQMIYLLMAQCVVSRVTAPFAAMTLDEYLARQLPDVLIHDFQSRFKQPMGTGRFHGEVAIDELRDRRRFVFLRTSVRFWDEQGGASDGEVSLAIVDRRDAARRGPAPGDAGPGAER